MKGVFIFGYLISSEIVLCDSATIISTRWENSNNLHATIDTINLTCPCILRCIIMYNRLNNKSIEQNTDQENCQISEPFAFRLLEMPLLPLFTPQSLCIRSCRHDANSYTCFIKQYDGIHQHPYRAHSWNLILLLY
jgi:hypothetical protein